MASRYMIEAAINATQAAWHGQYAEFTPSGNLPGKYVSIPTVQL